MPDTATTDFDLIIRTVLTCIPHFIKLDVLSARLNVTHLRTFVSKINCAEDAVIVTQFDPGRQQLFRLGSLHPAMQIRDWLPIRSDFHRAMSGTRLTQAAEQLHLM